jgi:hypothetical protein
VQCFPSVKLEIRHAPTLAAKVNASSTLGAFFRNECLYGGADNSNVAAIVSAMHGTYRIERLKDVLGQLESEAPVGSSHGRAAHMEYVRRSLKRLVLLEDLTLMHRSGTAGCYGVDEGIVHFGIAAYSHDEDFTFVLEGTRILAAQGLGAARGGWVQVIPGLSQQELTEEDVVFVAQLFARQVASGSRTFMVDSATNRRRTRDHDFIVVPGVGGLLYSTTWETCELLGPGSKCRELVEEFHSVSREAFEIRAGTSLAEIQEVTRHFSRMNGASQLGG